MSHFSLDRCQPGQDFLHGFPQLVLLFLKIRNVLRIDTSGLIGLLRILVQVVAAATEEAVKAYATEIGAGCDASAFYRTMQEQGWQSGGKPVRNWKAVFRAWEAKDKQKRENDRQSENAEAYESFIYNE